jgi:cytochrome c-type biogenesis protein CcmH/NrfG
MANQPARSKVSANVSWTSAQAYTMAIICLLIGGGLGWFLRGSLSPEAATSGAPVTQSSGTRGGVTDLGGMGQQASPEEMKRMADKQAEPLLAQLKMRPNDPALLTELGNIYYDTKQFKDAIDFYARVLKIQPSNTNVRTDMGIAYWEGMRDADAAIREFNKALSYEPNKPQTLQSIGIVKWQGKSDAKGAVAAWEKLLQTNPDYDRRADIQQLINQAKGQ